MQLFVYETVSALLSVSVSAESKQDIMAIIVNILSDSYFVNSNELKENIHTYMHHLLSLLKIIFLNFNTTFSIWIKTSPCEWRSKQKQQLNPIERNSSEAVSYALVPRGYVFLHRVVNWLHRLSNNSFASPGDVLV